MADKGTYSSVAPLGSAAAKADSLHLLIAACLRNERSAQKRFYDTYAAMIYGVIRRYTEDEAAAQDIQSEAFYRIFHRLGQYRFEGSFEGWMRRIAAHAVTDYFRRYRPADAQLNETTEDHAQFCGPNGLSGLSFKELLVMIHDLPTTQRTVFNLAVFEEYPHKEIAALLGITENNSRWHLNDARRRLKDKIAASNR